MEHDGPDDRMQEPAVVRALVGEADHGVQPIRQLLRRRRDMQNPLVAVIDDPDPFVPGALEPAARLRVVEGVGRQGGVQSQHPARGQRLVLDPPNGLHRPIVVEDHVLTAVPRAPARTDHVLRHYPRRRSPFELARSDRLLDQRINDEPVTEVRIRHLFGDADPAAELAVDPVQGLLHRIGQHEEEGPPPGVAQRQRAELAVSGQLHSQPPFLVVQAIRGNEVAQPVPVQVPSIDRWVEALVQHLGQTVAVLGKQCIERSWCEGQLHGRASARHPSRLATMTAGDDYPSLSIIFYHFWEN